MKKVAFAALTAGAAVLALPSVGMAQSQVGGVGWYLGLEGGLNQMRDTGLPGKEKLGFAAGGVVGYDWVGPRAEFEAVYRNNKVGGRSVDQIGGMANLYYDFFAGSTISPYLGLGVGVADVKDGRHSIELAYQGIAGLGWNITPNWRANLDGRYYATADAKGRGGAKFDNENLTAMLGVTYKFVQVATAAPPPAAPAPAPVVGNQFIVFFDFDRSDLTSAGQTTVNQAASAAKAGARTRVSVSGHADRSGSDQYNMALSLRRANTVKNALVAQGIPANQIVVVGNGETQPLVQTADGVQEPQNRRVEIVLN